MIWDILLLIFGIFLLIKGSDWFVDSGSEIGKIFKISEILLGLTLVAFGTSLPELIIAITGAQSGSTGVVIGNILGTNMVNVSGILAIICIIKPMKFLRETVRKDMYMSFLTAIVMVVIVSDVFLTNASVNMISRSDGIIFLLLFGVFMYYTLYEYIDYIKERKKNRNTEVKLKLRDIDHIVKNILFMILGLTMVYFGGDFVVDAVSNLAYKMHISEVFIAILVVAIGTSLPEVFTSIAAIKKGKPNIALGNLIGSTMFNTLFVLGTASIIHPIELPTDTLIVDAMVFAAVCMILVIFTKKNGKYELSRTEGVCLLSIYIAYISFVIIRK